MCKTIPLENNVLKKIGFVAATAVAGTMLFGGMASAHESGAPHGHAGPWADGGNDVSGQVGLVNLNNIDVLHNVNTVVGVCGNDVNVLGVQVPIRNALNGLNIPLLSPGANSAEGNGPYNCAAGAIEDGGTVQNN